MNIRIRPAGAGDIWALARLVEEIERYRTLAQCSTLQGEVKGILPIAAHSGP